MRIALAAPDDWREPQGGAFHSLNLSVEKGTWFSPWLPRDQHRRVHVTILPEVESLPAGLTLTEGRTERDLLTVTLNHDWSFHDRAHV